MTPDDPEVAYYREIERAFVERRGDPLFISNADWVFLAKLRRRGIPQRIVLRGIADAFDAHAHSFSRKQKIRSLSFCEGEITAAVARFRRAHRADGDPRRDLGEALLKLEARIGALPAVEGLSPALDEARERLRAIAEQFEGEPSFDVGPALNVVEDALYEAVSTVLGTEALRTFENDSREATSSFKSRMPDGVYETLIAESIRRKALQHFGLPRLLLAEVE